MLYATDASLYQVEPLGVAIPASIEDAAAAVRFCIDNGLPILPRGGGTSLAGQCTNAAVVIDFSARCNSILSVDQRARTCRVEPGITVDDLNDKIAATGLFFAPDPATARHCNIGGCIGNNAAGSRSILYGRTSENLAAVDVLTAAGARLSLHAGAAAAPGAPAELRDLTRRVCDVVARHAALIRERYPRTVRRNAGYQLDVILQQMQNAGWRDGEPVTDATLAAIDLAQLVCGSEGTLAVTLAATLKLMPRPAAKGLAVLGFASLDDAIDAVNPILTTRPSAVELLDDTVIDLALQNAEYRRYAEVMPQPQSGPLRAVLYVEYFAPSAGELHERLAALSSVVPGVAREDFTDAPSMANAWKLRKAGEPLLHGIPGHRKPLTFVEDNAVPVESLPRFVREFRAIVEAEGTRAAFYAHASVGVLHVRPLLDIHQADDRDRLRRIAVKIADLAKSLGGVMSGEHGDGRIRSPLLEQFYGPELMAAMREIKSIFDPRNLLNPGNIVEPRAIETMTTNLRVLPAPVGDEYGAARQGRPVPVPAVDTYFDYDDQHGFDAAVEMCNGAGVCRKKQGGTMCPSYMALLDERHATRGRGNALRLAITGQLPRSGESSSAPGGPSSPNWSDPETIQTLRLCLSCKACKTECPSNVDIARLKAEYTAQGYRAAGGAPLRARVFGAARAINRLGALAPGLANAVNSTRLAAWAREKLLGIDRRRTLPPFSRPLTRWRPAAAMPPARADASAPTVALFGDCFSMYNETGLGRDAVRVLEALGYNVAIVDGGCCARPQISTGLLAEAITTADATLDKLRPWIQSDAVAAILVLEPSCLSSFKDDWLALKLRTPITLRRALAAKSFLAEDFVASRWEAHPRTPAPAAISEAVAALGLTNVTLHGHCHQKALWGAQTSAAMLRRLVGDRLRVLDSGCCGMAGSFGYTTDRFDLSQQIGELSVLPAARAIANQPGAVMVAPGTSCRHQVHDATGVRALHPIELAAIVLDHASQESSKRSPVTAATSGPDSIMPATGYAQ